MLDVDEAQHHVRREAELCKPTRESLGHFLSAIDRLLVITPQELGTCRGWTWPSKTIWLVSMGGDAGRDFDQLTNTFKLRFLDCCQHLNATDSVLKTYGNHRIQR